MAVPYTFATATSAIPLSNLDSNFATAITIGSTAVYLGNTTTTIAGLTLSSPTLTTPALGTPSSGTLTNCTGLPVSTGVSGLGTGVGTFLATPSSANLATAVTDETGSGSLVFATSPTLVTPILGTPTSGTLTNTTGFPAANLAGTALPAAIVTSSLTSVGTITSGTWTGTTIAIAKGGTGQTTATAGFNALSPITTTGDLILGNGTNSATRLAIGANTYVLTSNGTTASWQASSGGGSGTVNSGTQYQLGYYATTGTAISGSSSIVTDASGNLLVGTTSAVDSSKVQISGAKVISAGIPQGQLNIADTSAIATGVGGGIAFSALYNGASYTTMGSIEGNRENGTSNNYAGTLVFKTRVNGGDNTERMRLTSGGVLVVNPAGGSSTSPAVDIYGGNPSGVAVGALRIGDSTYAIGPGQYWNIGRDNVFTGDFTFAANATVKATINLTTGVYTAISDLRLKKNIVNLNYGLAEVLRLRPVMYNMNEEIDNAKKHIGFIAQEVKTVIDESVDDLIDETLQFYGLDKSVFVPVLIKAMQEQQALITAQSATITLLTERITALEGART